MSKTVSHEPDGVFERPENACGTGVLVLAGSSGRVDSSRARLFAHHGAAAMSIRWFGDLGQPPGACEVPLETFMTALDRLNKESDRLAVVGVSYGAEAALLLGVHDARVEAVVALAPTYVVWANAGVGLDGLDSPPRSKWTLAGQPLPYVHYDQSWEPGASPTSFRSHYDQSLRTYADEVPAATIPVERIRGDVVLVAGGDDQVWASDTSAGLIAARRAAHGLTTTVITHPAAGHRTVLPGETAPPPRTDLAHGGSPQADSELGTMAWPTIAEALRLRL